MYKQKGACVSLNLDQIRVSICLHLRPEGVSHFLLFYSPDDIVTSIWFSRRIDSMCLILSGSHHDLIVLI